MKNNNKKNKTIRAIINTDNHELGLGRTGEVNAELYEMDDILMFFADGTSKTYFVSKDEIDIDPYSYPI